MKYLKAIKNIKKRYYLTPIPIFIVASQIYSHWIDWQRHGKYYENGVIIHWIYFPIIYWMTILFAICYPHANYWIQTTWLYRKIFRSASFLNQTFFGFSRLVEIDKNTPDDYETRETYLRGSNGRIYRSTYQGTPRGGKRHTAGGRQLMYIMFFIFKDIFLRIFAHFGVFMISPILFLIAVPSLEKKGYLEHLEKSKVA